MAVLQFLSVSLPTESSLFKAMKDSRKCTIDKIEPIREYLLAAIEGFIEAREELRELEYKEDPEYIFDLLSVLHNYSGGLLGLSDSLFRRIKSSEYLSALETEEGKKPPTHDIREYRARVSGCDLEGIIRMLDTNQRNILENMNLQQGRLRRR